MCSGICKILLKVVKSCLKTILSNFLGPWERTLTEQQFSLHYSFYFLNARVTSANFNLFWKLPLFKSGFESFNKYINVRINAAFQCPHRCITILVDLFWSAFKISFLTSFSLTEWNLNWLSSYCKKNMLLNTRITFKSINNYWKTCSGWYDTCF